MASNAKRKLRARAAGARRRTQPPGTMGSVSAQFLAEQLFGPAGRAKYSRVFPASDRFQVGVDQRTPKGMPGFAVIGSGRTWEAAFDDARQRLQDAERRAAEEAAKVAETAKSKAEAAMAAVTTGAPSGEATTP